MHSASRLVGEGEAGSDWGSWVERHSSSGGPSDHHQVVAAVRGASRAVHDAINARTTSIYARISNSTLPSQQLHLNLSRFPRLARLGVDLGQYDASRLDEENGRLLEFTPCVVHFDDLPTGLRELHAAAKPPGLDVRFHARLASMPTNPLPQLTALELHGMRLPTDGVPLQLFPSLQHLVLTGCSLPFGQQALILDLSHTPLLQHLCITTGQRIVIGSRLTVMLGASGAPGLANLTCTCISLPELDLLLPGGQQRTALQHLDISNSDGLTALDLSPAPNLVHLSCSGCRSLTQLDITPCSQLQFLSLHGSVLTTEVLDVEHCAATLQHLNIYGFRGSVAGLAQCTALQTLYWRFMLHASIDLQPLTSLQTLDVSESSQLTALDQLPPSLQSLNCSWCSSLQHLSLPGLHNLAELDCGNSAVSQLELPAGPDVQLARLRCSHNPICKLDVSGAPLLQVLDVRACDQLSQLDLPPVAPQLQKLFSLNCPELPYSLLPSAPNLVHLEVTSKGLDRLDISLFPALRELCISNAARLHGLDLSPLSHLTTLTLKGAAVKELDLAPVASTLTELWLVDCLLLVRIHSLKRCTALKWLEVKRCHNLFSVTVPVDSLRGAVIRPGDTQLNCA